MFCIRKGPKKNRVTPRLFNGSRVPERRPSHAFHPRVETLEGRTSPSVTHLTLSTPVLSIVETSYGISLTVRIDVLTLDLTSSGRSTSPTGVSRDASTATAQAASGSPAALAAPANVLNPDAGPAAASLRGGTLPGGAAPATTGGSGDLVAFTSSASAAAASRPIVFKPSVPEAPALLLGGFIGTADPQLLTKTTLLPTLNSVTPEMKLAPSPVLPVQAIANRMEFVGGAGAATDTTATNENPPDAPAPQLRPVNPPPSKSAEMASLGGMLGLPLNQAVLTDDSCWPDAMVLGTLVGQDGEGQETLSPELVSEAAALAACLVSFPLGLPPEVAARRGSERDSEMEILPGRKRIAH